MKTFQQFNEDLNQLQRNLDALDQREAPKQRLRARRQAAKERQQDVLDSFKKKSLESAQQQQREREAQRNTTT